MKKNNFTEFINGKGYYVLLFVGVLAIAAVAFIGSSLSTEQLDQDKEYVDLNEQDNNIAAEENPDLEADNNKGTDEVANKDATTPDSNEQTVVDNDSLLEYDVYTQEEEHGIELAEEDELIAPVTSNEVAAPDAVETTGSTIKAEITPIQKKLNFQDDSVMTWPVKGNVIMNYSMDRTIFHATLMQYKVHPAILIDAEVGTDVVAAADGVITKIEEASEISGYTLTMDIGNGYEVVYGQLENDGLWKLGDRVNEGDVIGQVTNPARYYVKEQPHVYFQVLKDSEPKAPMMWLK